MTDPSVQQGFCRNCGEQVRAGTAFCVSCGAALWCEPIFPDQ
jgi:hypothetical protein